MLSKSDSTGHTLCRILVPYLVQSGQSIRRADDGTAVLKGQPGGGEELLKLGTVDTTSAK